jgi:hypothetical protein
MNVTEDIWRGILNAIDTQRPPVWLREQLELGREAVLGLPILDVTGEGEHARPTVEEEVVKEDYLNFLREQIRLNARGPEWTALLGRRLAALEPVVGNKLVGVTFYAKPHVVTLWLCPESKELVHMEEL